MYSDSDSYSTLGAFPKTIMMPSIMGDDDGNNDWVDGGGSFDGPWLPLSMMVKLAMLALTINR